MVKFLTGLEARLLGNGTDKTLSMTAEEKGEIRDDSDILKGTHK